MLRLENVHKWFGSLHVLKGVSFDVSRGQVTVIIGRSGSGKSTILRCINGLEPIQEGRVSVDGELVDAHSRHVHKVREKVGFVFQSFNLFPYYTALENVSLAPRIVKGLPPAEASTSAPSFSGETSTVKACSGPDQSTLSKNAGFSALMARP